MSAKMILGKHRGYMSDNPDWYIRRGQVRRAFMQGQIHIYTTWKPQRSWGLVRFRPGYSTGFGEDAVFFVGCTQISLKQARRLRRWANGK